MGAREIATMHDESFMRMALRLAARGLGRTAPNPAVGCVLVKGGQIVGRGWTQAGGRPHAETVALAQAGDAARGATAYVTLEPCAHFGVTSPCADALIEAGIARVVIACSDPDPRTAGKGIMRLAAAGIETHIGICEADARALNAGFFLRLTKARPWVTLKCATSLDGCIATAQGESQWITHAAARAHAQGLRAQHDAILTGIGTVLADDPMLTCRLPGMNERSPMRVILDRQGRLPLSSALVKSARDTPVLLLSLVEDARLEVWREEGVEAVSLPDLDPPTVLANLAQRGFTRLMVEAGPRVLSAFYHSGLVDSLYWYRGNMILGQAARPVILADALPLSAHPRWQESHHLTFSSFDRMTIYKPAAC